MKISIQDFKLSAVKDAAFKLQDDTYYNLFNGGYIDPEDLLNDKDKALNVRNAMKIIINYLDVAETLAMEYQEEEDE